MSGKKSVANPADELRKQAEQIAREQSIQKPENLESLTTEEIRQTLHELRVHQIELEMQNDELRLTQIELEKAQARYFDLYDLAPVGYCTVNENGLIREANLTAATMLGVTRSALVRKPLTHFIFKEDQDIYRYHIKLGEAASRLEYGDAQSLEAVTCDLRVVRKNGTLFWGRLTMTVASEDEGTNVYRVVLNDITERKLQQDEQALTAQLIVLVNTPGDFRSRMADLTASLQGWSGCEAVGIRLRDGDNYPYYETCGFLPSFIQAESHLCAYDRDGKILRDDTGNPILKCMCGNILRGRFDPAKPFFTTHGSFWSNNTSALLANTTETDRQALTRNRCNGEGYESVALIPLRTSQQVFGLLQFNDRRPDRFSAGMIEHFERMADSLSIALAQRQADEALQDREEKYRHLFNNAEVGIFRTRLDGSEVLEVNRRFLDIVGMTLEETIGKPSVNLWADPKERAEMAKMLVANGSISGFEYKMLNKRHGDVRNCLTSLRLYREQGILEGSILDITDQKHAEEAKRNLEERLHNAEKMEMMGKLAGRVAHDLNNVLGVLSGYSELLADRIPADSPLRTFANHILQSSEKAATIVEDLLTLTRRGVRIMELVRINKIITNLMTTPEFDKLVAYHPSVIVTADLAKDLLNISGSPVHLEKAIFNLVSNAAEAIVGDGKVTIKTENCYLDKAVEGNQTVREGEYVVLTVTDTGKGIPASELKAIFEPFYTKKAMGRSGTGLGLAIVLGTVQDHNGYIDVQSIEGKGSTFTLYFPATKESAEEAPQMPMEQYLGHGESVLVVDDVQDQRNVATAILTQLGYRVHAVSSGEDAVEYLKGNKADILVLDMIMEPGIDGLDTYKQILEINPHQKAIIVSGFSETDRSKGAQKLGAGLYVKKPYLKGKIGLAIRNELARK